MATPPLLPDMTPEEAEAATAFVKLLRVMSALRNPQTGCPWDLEQNFATIAPYTIEEAYEVADAIKRNDLPELCNELGDLLFQVVFHAQMAQEAGHFAAGDIVNAIVDKMVRRHPHVFDAPDGRDASDQTQAWEEMKAEERAKGMAAQREPSALDGVALALPALMRAEKLQKRAARVGFDWSEPEPIFDKLDEEVAELKTAISDNDASAMVDETGDVLFVAANLARRLGVDPEVALRSTNDKFERRFRQMETLASARGEDFGSLDLESQESLWQAVKRQENT